MKKTIEKNIFPKLEPNQQIKMIFWIELNWIELNWIELNQIELN